MYEYNAEVLRVVKGAKMGLKDRDKPRQTATNRDRMTHPQALNSDKLVPFCLTPTKNPNKPRLLSLACHMLYKEI